MVITLTTQMVWEVQRSVSLLTYSHSLWVSWASEIGSGGWRHRSSAGWTVFTFWFCSWVYGSESTVSSFLATPSLSLHSSLLLSPASQYREDFLHLRAGLFFVHRFSLLLWLLISTVQKWEFSFFSLSLLLGIYLNVMNSECLADWMGKKFKVQREIIKI